MTTTSDSPTLLVAGDFDGDLDLATANTSSTNFDVWTNQGNASFKLASQFGRYQRRGAGRR